MEHRHIAFLSVEALVDEAERPDAGTDLPEGMEGGCVGEVGDLHVEQTGDYLEIRPDAMMNLVQEPFFFGEEALLASGELPELKAGIVDGVLLPSQEAIRLLSLTEADIDEDEEYREQ
jgi:hypothetical protein